MVSQIKSVTKFHSTCSTCIHIMHSVYGVINRNCIVFAFDLIVFIVYWFFLKQYNQVAVECCWLMMSLNGSLCALLLLWLGNSRSYSYLLLLPLHYIQGHRTQIDAFQNTIEWYFVKRQWLLGSWDRKTLYETFYLGIFMFSWSISLHIWKIQQVFCLVFSAILILFNSSN